MLGPMVEIFASLLAGALALAVGPMLAARAKQGWKRKAFLAATIHPALVIVLYYSLAIHMYVSLGGWPESLGERGFPQELVTHATLSFAVFSALFLAMLFAWPAMTFVCSAVPRWRSALPYLGTSAAASVAVFVAMALAPDQFQFWWWD